MSSYGQIVPILELQDKYEQVHSVSIVYDGDLMVAIIFEPDLYLPYGAFVFICQTLRGAFVNCEFIWKADVISGRNCLLFKAVDCDGDK